MAFLAGKNGGVQLNTVAYKFGKWSANLEGDAPDVTNFSSGGFDENIDGLHRGDVSIDGPYDAGAMALSIGTVYTFLLQMSQSLSISVPARLVSVTPTVDVKDAVRLSIKAKSTGTFTPNLT